MKRRILLVFGTRPEAIKMAPLVKAFEHNDDQFETMIAVTAQHREMLDQVLNLFEIKPHFDLDIMKQGQDLFDVTTRVLTGLKEIYEKSRPDIVFVHGDTTTSMAAALAAFYLKIPVAHIEAGLRTRDLNNPWPEELNRQITGRITKYHFAPTTLARQNLIDEQVPTQHIYVTGNTVIDALMLVLKKIDASSEQTTAIEDILSKENLSGELIKKWKEGNRRLVLITGHRRENFGDGFLNICKAIHTVAVKFPTVDFVYPVHLNPNVQKPVYELLGEIQNVHLLNPLEYLPFVFLLNHSYLVLTDSGGIQEEAPGLGKPVLVMRTTTERPEAVTAGTVKLVGTNTEVIIQEMSSLLTNKQLYERMSKAINPYGDGKACERILDVMLQMPKA